MAGVDTSAAQESASQLASNRGVRWKERLQVTLYALVLGWLNAYVCRDLFWNHRAPMNSMHGFWSGLARLAGPDWLRLNWWPYWDCGIPLQFTYAPLAPVLTAGLAAVRGIPHILAFDSLTGIIYCVGPVTLFLMAWRLSRSPGLSFAAALLYSLTALSQIPVPDGAFAWQHIWDARRLYLMAVWDETPHMVAMTLLPAAVVFLALSIRERRWIYYAGAVASVTGMALSSAFGPIEALMVALCLAYVLDPQRIRRNMLLLGAIGASAYAISALFLPPSLILAMHAASVQSDGDMWHTSAISGFALAVLGWVVLRHFLSKWTRDWWLQFVVLFAYLVSCPPVLTTYFHCQFLPQPNRYKVEMEFAFAIAIPFCAGYAIRRLPHAVRAGLLFLLMSLTVEQIVSHRRVAKEMLASADISQSIEYRASKWAAENLRGVRVMMPGSIAVWANAFTELHQFTGGSWSMGYDPVQQRAVDAIHTSTGDKEADVLRSVVWLKAYGVGAVCVSGKASPEYWKPFQNPATFEGVLPVLWQERDTTIYRVPQQKASLAHLVPESAIVRRLPSGPAGGTELGRYVAALDDPSLPPADLEWHEVNRIRIHISPQPGEVLSLAISYHPGWHARNGRKELAVQRDELGLMWLRPECTGPCDLQLEYDGGWELRICRLLSATSAVLFLLAVPLVLFLRRR